MTTAVEDVSSAVRRYAASISAGMGAMPEVFDALAHYVGGGLEPGEAVLAVACLRNPRLDGTTAAGLAVLTDRALLLAEEGAPGQRIALADISDVRGVDVNYGGGQYPALDLFQDGAHNRIVAAPVDGGNYKTTRAELQAFVTAMMGAADRVRPHQPAVEVAQVASPAPAPQPVAAAAQAPAPEPAPAPAPAVDVGTSGATASDEYGKAKFVGDAAPIGGIPLSRLFNSICYVIAGIALVVMSQLAGFPGGGTMAFAIIAGLAAIAYGAKIALTRSSYWVSSWVYVLAFGAVAAMFGLLAK